MALVFSNNQLLLQRKPLVVGAISDAGTLRATAAAVHQKDLCDIFEIRLDLIDLPVSEIRPLAQKLELPLLFTARHPDEGGAGNLSAQQRAEKLESVLDLAALIDVELRSAMDLASTLQKARAAKIPVIGSFHNFQATPSLEVLEGSVDFGQQFKFDAVKIATYLQQGEDLVKLLQVLTKARHLPISAMGMGPMGKVSRLTLARLGSILNYGFLGSANAPGQWEAPELKRLIQEL